MSNIEDEVRRIVSEFEDREASGAFDALFPMSTDEFDEDDATSIEKDLEEFERQLDEGEQISVREYIGSPVVRPLCEIPSEELEDEVYRILDIMLENYLVLDFLYDVEVAEAYRFITEELLDEMMTDVRVPEFYTHFIYEEFHPNDVEDIKQAGEWFLEGFLGARDVDVWSTYVHDGVLNQTGELIALTQIVRLMDNFQLLHSPVTPYSVEALRATVEGDEGVAAFLVTWHQDDPGEPEYVRKTADVVMHFRRSPYGGWDIVKATLPFD